MTITGCERESSSFGSEVSALHLQGKLHQRPRQIMRPIVLALLLSTTLALPAAAQWRVSLGAGGAIAGSTESSLSDGKGGALFMGQIVRGGLPLVGVGAEVNRWSRGTLNTTFATGIIQAHVPLTGLLLKVGVGYGTGDPDGLGKINGATVQFGAGYDLTVPFAPIAATFFGNALVSHASSRSMQLVGVGVALTFR